MTKYVPIIAIVPESVARTIDNVAEAMGDPEPEVSELMARNGWTMTSIVAGSMIRDGLRSNGVPA